MTTKVINKIRVADREMLCVSEISSGIESAAASETTPRIPAQPKITGFRHPGLASATVIKLLINLVKRNVPKVQSNRVTISTKEIIKPYQDRASQTDVAELCGDGRQLQTDEQKNQTVQNENEIVPDINGLECGCDNRSIVWR